ncbi:hypothetical protein BY996DRAFT_4589769, partial [Phakopsora pachyrhizi]
QQASLLSQVEEFVKSYADLKEGDEARLSLPASYPAKDRKFLRDLASELKLWISFDKFDKNDEPLIALSFDLENQDKIASLENPLEDILDYLQIDESE